MSLACASRPLCVTIVGDGAVGKTSLLAGTLSLYHATADATHAFERGGDHNSSGDGNVVDAGARRARTSALVYAGHNDDDNNNNNNNNNEQRRQKKENTKKTKRRDDAEPAAAAAAAAATQTGVPVSLDLWLDDAGGVDDEFGARSAPSSLRQSVIELREHVAHSLCAASPSPSPSSPSSSSPSPINVVLVLFSVISPTSFASLRTHYAERVRALGADTHVLLVGTKADLRGDPLLCTRLAERGMTPVSTVDARRAVGELGATAYVEVNTTDARSVAELWQRVWTTAAAGDQATMTTAKKPSSNAAGDEQRTRTATTAKHVKHTKHTRHAKSMKHSGCVVQ